MTTVAELVTQLVQRNRRLWGGICWGITTVTAGFGVPLAIGGAHVTPLTAAYAAITRYVPGGIHAYGALMIAFAVSFLAGLLRPVITHDPMPERWLHLVLACFCGFALGIVAAFGASWALTGVKTWQAMIYWTVLAGFALLAARETPTPSGSTGAQ